MPHTTRSSVPLRSIYEKAIPKRPGFYSLKVGTNQLHCAPCADLRQKFMDFQVLEEYPPAPSASNNLPDANVQREPILFCWETHGSGRYDLDLR